MDHDLELISPVLEILEISVFLYFWTPGNIGNLIFLYFGTPGNITQTQNPIPNPNPYPFLDPGRVIPGNAGGPGPGRRAHPETQTHWGATRPQTPRRVFSGQAGCSVIFFERLILLILIQRHILLTSYFINVVNPVSPSW